MKRLPFLFLLALLAAGGIDLPDFDELPDEQAPDASPVFTAETNGFLTQTEMDAAREEFEERETVETGLGPVYNAQGCADCHQTPVTGGSSQVTELRAGHSDNGRFVELRGGSLVNDRAISALIQERIVDRNEIRTFRVSPSLFGAGFVEAIDSQTLRDNVARQPAAQRGTLIEVPLLEAPGLVRVGRFGHKCQHASLLSFSADAYLNEIGITTPLQPTENTSLGRDVSAFDNVADPEDDEDFITFASFMRSLQNPPRASAATTARAAAGESLFLAAGCAVCHTPAIRTAPTGTPINGGLFIVPAALGGKIIHPYGDFALHNIGTGDGIVQNGPQSTANQVRTAALWGLRARARLMHDGESLQRNDAILRHAGQATAARQRYQALDRREKNDLIFFLNTL